MNIFYLSLFFVYSHKYKTLRYHFCIRILCCQFVVEVPHAELGHLGTCESLPSCRHSVFTMKTFTCGAQDLAWALVILDFCGACTSLYKLVQAQTSHVPVSWCGRWRHTASFSDFVRQTGLMQNKRLLDAKNLDIYHNLYTLLRVHGPDFMLESLKIKGEKLHYI